MNVMEKETKDMTSDTPNGDGRSPINESEKDKRPRGIFFLANVDNLTGKMLNPIYGDTRFSQRMDDMIVSCKNMYFADFYCRDSSKKDRKHYATLLMTSPDSTETFREERNIDAWCQQKLIPFEYETPNNLLYRQDGTWFVSKYIYIEVFFTENVRIADGFLENVECEEIRRTKAVEKHPSCAHCNF